MTTKQTNSAEKLLERQAGLMTEQQTAETLGVSPGTLRVWRCNRRYPLAWIKLGRAIRYDPREVERFIRDNTQTPASID